MKFKVDDEVTIKQHPYSDKFGTTGMKAKIIGINTDGYAYKVDLLGKTTKEGYTYDYFEDEFLELVNCSDSLQSRGFSDLVGGRFSVRYKNLDNYMKRTPLRNCEIDYIEGELVNVNDKSLYFDGNYGFHIINADLIIEMHEISK